MRVTDKVLDTVNDLIVEHDFEVINGEDFGKYTVKQHEFDYDSVDVGYGFHGSIKTGKTVYEGMGLKISIDWSCTCEADNELGIEDDKDFEFEYHVEQVAITNGLMTIA
jgi:hypothetical protein